MSQDNFQPLPPSSSSGAAPGGEDAPNGSSAPAIGRAKFDFVHDEHFYFRSVIFRAGMTHFRVPIYGLPSEDGIFAAMLALPNENGEGTSDENPICLPPEVTAEDFRSLLKACVPMPSGSEPKLTVDEWMSVLKLSTMWCLDSLRARAIATADEGISRLANEGRIMDKILLAKQHRISRWLIEGYEALGKRDAHLLPSEREQLGVKTSFRVWELREESWRWAHPKTRLRVVFGMEPGKSCRNRDEFDFHSAVVRIFGDELCLDPDYEPVKKPNKEELAVVGETLPGNIRYCSPIPILLHSEC